MTLKNYQKNTAPPSNKTQNGSNLRKPPGKKSTLNVTTWVFSVRQETTTKSVTTKRSQVSKERAMPKASKFTLANFKSCAFSQPRQNTVGLGCWAKGLPLTNLSCFDPLVGNSHPTNWNFSERGAMKCQ